MYTFYHYNFSNANTLSIIVHGASEGIESPFMHKLRLKLMGGNQSFLFIQMPFKDRGESQTSTLQLSEEIDCVKNVLNSINLEQFETIHFVGKSLGGYILNTFIERNTEFFGKKNVLFTIFGYLAENYIISNKFETVNIINGEKDRYASLEQIKVKIQDRNNIVLHPIAESDHSYRDDNKVGVYEDRAISFL